MAYSGVTMQMHLFEGIIRAHVGSASAVYLDPQTPLCSQKEGDDGFVTRMNGSMVAEVGTTGLCLPPAREADQRCFRLQNYYRKYIRVLNIALGSGESAQTVRGICVGESERRGRRGRLEQSNLGKVPKTG